MLRLDRVLALVEPGNERSLAVCHRLGMTHCGQTDRYWGLTLGLFRIGRADSGGLPDRAHPA